MAKHGRGLICLTLTEEKCRQLNLPLMVSANQSRMGTNFTVSIEAAQGVTTGISATDRARTVQVAVNRDARPTDIVQPGHIFPLRAEPGGVLVRAGHTEAGCDLARMAGLAPASVICEILKDDGEMARLPELIEFARVHGLRIGAISELIHHRSQTETLVRLVAYHDQPMGETHLALVKGEISAAEETLVRVHEPLSIVDLLDSASTRHSWNLHQAMKAIADNGRGVLVLLYRNESGEDLLQRARAAEPTTDSQPKLALRNYGIGAQILRDLGVRRMKVLGAPRKMPSMAGFDLELTGYLLPGH
jgi:3,4-dihydroxy 2-butanone 4-phosphate synthase/GTP cyclohydrolase II